MSAPNPLWDARDVLKIDLTRSQCHARTAKSNGKELCCIVIINQVQKAETTLAELARVDPSQAIHSARLELLAGQLTCGNEVHKEQAPDFVSLFKQRIREHLRATKESESAGVKDGETS